jgi:hypothetical protein
VVEQVEGRSGADVGQALVGPPDRLRDPLVALGLEEVRVDADGVRGELLVERLGPGAVTGSVAGSSKGVMIRAMTPASR